MRRHAAWVWGVALLLALFGRVVDVRASTVTAEAEVEAETELSVEVGLPGYREAIAQQLRFFAQSSYCSIDTVTTWACPTCRQGSLANFKLTHKFFDPQTNTFGYAGLAPAAAENIIVFAFRGATPSAGRNWITDLNAQRMPYPGLAGATVHKGFYNAYLSIARQVNLAAKSLLANCPGCHIYLTGHSLGGAIATLAAADLYALTPDLTLYTFGSPRVGDLAFASYFDKIVPDTYRIVHEKDLVPHIPQRFLGFRHVSREIWYHAAADGAPQYKECAGGEDDACSNSVNLNVDENSIKDHAIYLDQPMGCRPADLSRMGLISMLEEESVFAEQAQAPKASAKKSNRPASNPLEKLRAKYTDSDVLLEVEAGAEVEAEAEAESEPAPTPSLKDLETLELDAENKARNLELSGGREVFPARVLDPLSKPSLRQMENRFHKVQSAWAKLPASWSPKVKEQTAEEEWNRKYPEPKD